MTAADDLLARFPKVRKPLPPAHAAIYADHYKENRSGGSTASSLAQRMERWMHAAVAADLRTGVPATTLELGAGTLNQLAHEPVAGPYDIVEPFAALYADSPHRGRVRAVYADLSQAPTDGLYDRITSVATLEHICDLPLVLARAATLLASGGTFRAAIPSEGGLLWTLGWMATTGLEFRLRRGLDYGVLMAHEHVNTAGEIETLVKTLFEEVRIRSFGLGRQLSLYRFIEARAPRLERAQTWIDRFQGEGAQT